MIAADLVRYIALALSLGAFVLFPTAVAIQGRPASAWLAVAGCEALLFSASLTVVDYLGHPLVWYRTPFVLLGSALLLAFCLPQLHARRQARA